MHQRFAYGEYGERILYQGHARKHLAEHLWLAVSSIEAEGPHGQARREVQQCVGAEHAC